MTVPAPRLFVVLARAVNAAFFFVTAVYCLLNYSPFTHEQFIRPQVSPALAAFAVWHGHLHLLVLSMTALTLAPFLERPRLTAIGWTYLAASAALGAWLFVNPLWRQEGMSGVNVVLALVAAVPPIWLAVFDHATLGAAPWAAVGLSNSRRTWTTCWLTALFAFAVFAAIAPLRLRLTGGIALPPAGLFLGWGVSVVGHVTLFTLVYLALAVVGGVAALERRSPGRTEYWLLWAVSATAMVLVLLRVLLAPIGVRGPAAWIVAVAMGVAFAAAWSGVACHRRRPGSMSALEAWLAPIASSRRASAVALGLVPVAAHVLIGRVATFDWEFMLQKLVTLALWLSAFAFIHTLVRDRRSNRALLMAPAVAIALFAAEQVVLARLPATVGDGRLNPEFALDGYAAVDPSFRIARDTLGSGPSADATLFYAFLRANSAIRAESIAPVDIDFVHRWSHSGERPPHVFLFIIDSLRPDYLSAYNRDVTFTPAIGAFGKDSFVFKRAFSRYAGTGLSVPSIWAGSMLIHKQYVTPFAPMNALEKLVTAKGYRRLITEDHLTDQLFTASASTVGLDHNVPEMLHTFCRTMGELGRQLETIQPDGPPLFVLTRPLDLHIGNIASASVPAGESYPGFHPPYAARVRRIDTCFGEFVETLKRERLYHDSIIVLTSDHGDSLGEGQRWGHGFTAFPEVLRIPLVVHLPERLRDRVSTDLARVSFSTDVTPTLYALLGEAPANRVSTDGRRGVRDLLLGSPLFVAPSADLSWRRRESYLVASSYGPVYGLISRNGRRLYLADGVESREYAYALGPDGIDVRIGMTDTERDADRRAIREQIAELAAWYGFTPGP